MRVLYLIFALLIFTTEINSHPDLSNPEDKSLTDYSELEKLFIEWRNFENPPLRNGAPDYTSETFDKRWDEFQDFKQKLISIDTAGWSVNQKVDWNILLAEMNGFDFNYNILKPWVRDPAFYKTIWMARSDVPAHEGPTHHMTTEVWQYDFPLDEKGVNTLIEDLKIIPPLHAQAKFNLKGNARELWITGIRTIDNQIEDLNSIKKFPGVSKNGKLIQVIEEAISSTRNFSQWLKTEAKKKTGPSGIGKENYTWYLQNVHLVPLTWEDEVMLMKRELARAWSALKLEEHRNRDLPAIEPASSEDEYIELARRSAKSLINFLEEEEIVSVKEYFEPALNVHLGEFIPEEKRHFFWIGAHFDPRPLYSHFYHWFELARMDLEPNESIIRQQPLLYNIFDSRNEGLATAVEEIFMDAGLYDEDPRVREIVYIMIAQRAARGLGSLYAHANMMTMEEAGGVHTEYTPRGWMKTEKDLMIFEQHLYMRQPGYGTSYITGKYLAEKAMMEYAMQKELSGEEFKLKEFFDKLNSIGNIPMTLASWEMTGSKPEF
ncbi:DUF885 domain-containing protein [Mangrovivirga cuniculi]|uniref:DUF885 domain-containing protein n=1 Tax=Mangrovivirga cuniculi TaxID=2715131 RepID=A0A4D7JH04_9BACT|nr:DUF885 family protein [Mangrovivirga cuniculi]QCK14881.1 hypothetical protein DCC35_09075 [Mangrovivirga cuniculi]